VDEQRAWDARVARTIGIVTAAGAILAAVLVCDKTHESAHWMWEVPRALLPASLVVYARLWMAEGRARERERAARKQQ
jgi:uncharacterized membrane protein